MRREFTLMIAVTIIVLALGTIVAYDLRQTAADANRLRERLSRGLELIDELQFTTQEVRRILLYALHTSDANRQLEYAEQSRRVDATVTRLLDHRASFDPSPQTEHHLDEFAQAWREYLVVRDEVIGLILERSLSESVALDENLGTARFNEVRRIIADLKRNFESEATRQVEQAQDHTERATFRLLMLVASALVATIVGMYLTNRSAALEKLLATEARKGGILEAVPDPIISTDASGRIVEFNPAAERAFEISRAQALGTDVELRILPERFRGVLTSALAAAADETSRRIELLGCRRTGAEFPMELAVVTHREKNEQMWTMHISDLTTRQQVEEQLRRAKDAAEAADRAKSDFLSTISHELRTPLHAVVGAANLLERAGLPATASELVRLLRGSTTALLALVTDLLDYSRIEAGLTQLVLTRFALHSCIEDALDQVRDLAARKRLQLGYVIDPDVPAVLVADESRVRQVLLNLLSNAVKFSDAGQVAVRARATRLHANNVVITIRVEDTGRGIAADLQPKLFQRFTQLDTTTNREHGGVGLGLAISEKLSRLLGGALTVESTEGIGSTFAFSFAARTEPADLGDPQSLNLSLAGLRVLTRLQPGIVSEQIHSLLDRWGARVEDVPALAAPAEQSRYDVLLDDSDGADEHNLHAQPLVKVVWSPTADDQVDDAPDSVVKPVRARALFETISLVTGRTDYALTAPSAPLPQFPADALAVLLVEDHDGNRQIAKMMLEELGLQADEAATGFEAIARASDRRYDVILMDLQMPGLDGLEATRRILALQQSPPPVLVAMTASVTTTDEQRCRAAGLSIFLPKPVQLDALADMCAALVPSPRR